jgi:hypothetical protein
MKTAGFSGHRSIDSTPLARDVEAPPTFFIDFLQRIHHDGISSFPLYMLSRDAGGTHPIPIAPHFMMDSLKSFILPIAYRLFRVVIPANAEIRYDQLFTGCRAYVGMRKNIYLRFSDERAKSQPDGYAEIVMYKASCFHGCEVIHVVFQAPGESMITQ